MSSKHTETTNIIKCVSLSNLFNPYTEDNSQREYKSMCWSVYHTPAI